MSIITPAAASAAGQDTIRAEARALDQLAEALGLGHCRGDDVVGGHDLIELTDVLFAVDSVPAVLAVSREQFLVFASNAFAILGLRALYFLLADMHARFSYLQQGLAIILAFVGMKMIIHGWYHIPTWLSLMVIALVLAASVGFSLRVETAPDSISIPEEPPPPQER